MSERLRGWAGSRGVDWLRALVVTGLLVYGAVGEAHPIQAGDQISGGHHVPVPSWPAYLLVMVAAMALAWWRRRPLTMLSVSLAATLAYTALGYVNGAVLVAPAIAVYAVATALPWRRATVAAAIAFALLVGFTMAFNPPGFGPLGGGVVLLPGLVAAPLFAGIAVASNRARIAAIRERAELAERTREDEARRRVDEERLRIARELHDVIAHTMATINVQAGVAAHVSPDLPPQVATALTEIKHASKNGLRELRAILAVLRPVDEVENTAPTPGLADLDTLIGSARSAGLDVCVRICGVRRTLPTVVDLAAYRIVQESLTNTLRYAGPAHSTVRLDFREHGLYVEVRDDGVGAAAVDDGHVPGHGLTGMRERTVAVGGRMDAKPLCSKGFRVRAYLPSERES